MDKQLAAIVRFYRNTNRYWYNKYVTASDTVGIYITRQAATDAGTDTSEGDALILGILIEYTA
jgi:hypothetical protein